MNSFNWVIDTGQTNPKMFQIQNIVASENSPYQKILIADTTSYGRALFLDGRPQSSSLDEHIYHEAFVHPALVACESPKKIFIAGGGEGAMLREVLRHNTVETVVMADIDKVVVDLAKEHLRSWHQGAFNDSRVQVVFQDARDYLNGIEESFDCIFLDTTDPYLNNPSIMLFTLEFFKIVKSHLAPKGIFAMLAENADFGQCEAHISLIKTLRQVFGCVLPYNTAIPFFGLSIGLALACNSPCMDRFDSINEILQERSCDNLRFYDAETHQHMFSLPKHLRSLMSDPIFGTIFTDSAPPGIKR